MAYGDNALLLDSNNKPIPQAYDPVTDDFVPLVADSSGRILLGGAISISPTITVTATAYEAADMIGGKLTLANAVRVAAGKSLLTSIHLFDNANQKPACNIFLFNDDPSAATLTDESALAWSTDATKVRHFVQVTVGDWVTVDSKAFASIGGINKIISPASGTTLYAAIMTTSTPTFGATSDFKITFDFLYLD